MECYLETIKIVDGLVQALPYHIERMRRTMKQPPRLVIQVPPDARRGVYKCRVLYSDVIEKIDFLPYHLPNIHRVKMVEVPHLCYSRKSADRKGLEQLREQYAAFDDVLIMQHGLLTDATFANVVVERNKVWYTPAKPLLLGTKREQFIEQRLIKEADIDADFLMQAQRVWLINAMLDIGDVQIDTIEPL